MTRRGGGVSAAMRFGAAGEPLRVTICHCTSCRHRAGAAFGIGAVFEANQVTITGEEPGRRRHVSDESGRWLDIEFCRRRGTYLGFALEAAPGLRTLPAGAFDDTGWINPERTEIRYVFILSRRAAPGRISRRSSRPTRATSAAVRPHAHGFASSGQIGRLILV